MKSQEEKMKEELEALNKRLLDALQENTSLIGKKKPADPDPDPDKQLREDAERLLEKFSVGSDASVDESPEAYRMRKQNEKDTRERIGNMGIKVWA